MKLFSLYPENLKNKKEYAELNIGLLNDIHLLPDYDPSLKTVIQKEESKFYIEYNLLQNSSKD